MSLLSKMISAIEWIDGWIRRHSSGRGVSFLIPFQCKDLTHQRVKNWKWLREYWAYHFPLAEIIVGVDALSEENPGIPFSKSTAINEAASRATGDILIIVDADGFLKISDVKRCIHQIREAREEDKRLWFIPYRRFYRLSERASARLLSSDVRDPYQFPSPPNPADIQNTSGSQHGHWFGAGIQIMPREAFDAVGCWDERFRGWGGEDHAAMRATDTLYWPHKTLPSQFLHVWHPMYNPKGASADWVDWKDRVWVNQTESGANDRLSAKYYGAYGDSKRMRRLVEEGRMK